MLITALAWLSIQASVTLAAILTVILLPWALLTARRSLTLAALALGVGWDDVAGRNWKIACLRAERLLQQPSQSRQPALPTKAFVVRASESLGAVFGRHANGLYRDHWRPVHPLSSLDRLVHGWPPVHKCDLDTLFTNSSNSSSVYRRK